MNWIGIITKVLTGVNVLVCLLLILLVLLQRPKNEGLGAAFGGETASNIFGAQTTNVLANLTRWMGSIFLGLCLLIAILGTHDKEVRGKTLAWFKKAEKEKEDADRKKAAAEAALKAAAEAKATQQGIAPEADPLKKPGLPEGVPVPLGTPAPERPATPATPSTEKPATPPVPSPEKPATPAVPAPEKPASPPIPAPEPVKPPEIKPGENKPPGEAPAGTSPAAPKPVENKGGEIPQPPAVPPAPGNNGAK